MGKAISRTRKMYMLYLHRARWGEEGKGAEWQTGNDRAAATEVRQ